MSLSSLMGGIGSFKRIQEFVSVKPMAERRKFPSLLHDCNGASMLELDCDFDENSDTSQKEGVSSKISDVNSTGSPAVVIENGIFGWNRDGPSGTLHEINMIVPRGKITMVVGPVGCGKSTLLKAILGEVPFMRGTLQVSSLRVALCDQTAWHVNSTIQQSIVGVSDFDQRWYSSVVHSCALDEDLRQLPLGDQTQIGSKAVALSGGQSQRIVRYSSIRLTFISVFADQCILIGTCEGSLCKKGYRYS